MRNQYLRNFVFAFVGVFALSSHAGAQATVDPRFAEFTASTDHNVIVDGQALVTGYTLQFYLPGAQQPFQTAPLGKPTPDASSLIRIDLATSLTAFPAPGVVYEARVSANGPGGSAVSGASNQFQFSDPCAASLSATAATVAAGANTGSFTVTTGAACSWTAASNRSWLTITNGGTRTGSGSVAFSVTANTSTSVRTGTITAAGLAYTVTQSAAACSYSLTPTSASAPAAGSNGTLSVTALTGCGWTAVSNASWIQVTSGASGSGNGSVSYAVAANTSASTRSGTVTVAGRVFTVSQAAACTFSVTPATQAVAAAGGSATYTVTTATGCAWTASSNAAWVTISAGSSRSGAGTVNVDVGANTGSSGRSATLLIAGVTVSVTQAAVTAAPLPPTNLRIIR